MDKELLKKYNLMESQKKFKKLYEYTFITDDLNEDDDNPSDDMMNMPDNPPTQETPAQAQQDQDAMPDMGQDMNQGGEEEVTGIEDVPQSDEANPETSQLGDTLDEPEEDVEEIDMEEDEEVVDVDDLTSSQEETEIKVGEVDKKISLLINLIDKFEDAITQNDAKIEDLKKEFELRNPTEVEKLNMRSQDSLPFTVSPKDYWEDKSKNSNYNVEFNNSVSPNEEEKEYVIRKGDITNISDTKGISNSFSDDEDLDQDINSIFGL